MAVKATIPCIYPRCRILVLSFPVHCHRKGVCQPCRVSCKRCCSCSSAPKLSILKRQGKHDMHRGSSWRGRRVRVWTWRTWTLLWCDFSSGLVPSHRDLDSWTLLYIVRPSLSKLQATLAMFGRRGIGRIFRDLVHQRNRLSRSNGDQTSSRIDYTPSSACFDKVVRRCTRRRSVLAAFQLLDCKCTPCFLGLCLILLFAPRGR